MWTSAPSTTAVISMPVTNSMRASPQAALDAAAPAVVSWLVTLRTSTPPAAARATRDARARRRGGGDELGRRAAAVRRGRVGVEIDHRCAFALAAGLVAGF